MIDFQKVRVAETQIQKAGEATHNLDERTLRTVVAVEHLIMALQASENPAPDPKLEQAINNVDVGAGYDLVPDGALIQEGDETRCHEPSGIRWLPTAFAGHRVGDCAGTTGYYRRKKPVPEMPSPSECFSTTTGMIGAAKSAEENKNLRAECETLRANLEKAEAEIARLKSELAQAQQDALRWSAEAEQTTKHAEHLLRSAALPESFVAAREAYREAKGSYHSTAHRVAVCEALAEEANKLPEALKLEAAPRQKLSRKAQCLKWVKPGEVFECSADADNNCTACDGDEAEQQQACCEIGAPVNNVVVTPETFTGQSRINLNGYFVGRTDESQAEEIAHNMRRAIQIMPTRPCSHASLVETQRAEMRSLNETIHRQHNEIEKLRAAALPLIDVLAEATRKA